MTLFSHDCKENPCKPVVRFLRSLAYFFHRSWVNVVKKIKPEAMQIRMPNVSASKTNLQNQILSFLYGFCRNSEFILQH
ncbi:hypothetical protein DMB65_03490 [Flavobacterium cheongpyeongense]|uniref:Uncharacterized protein n=1 Tax=Flavobacterium cheongpyeongense TaxID=2212651 RepID=A0A2V4C7X3_9FLAO|nr:hypothetical protein DMB65_03490 [Flavobacterium cheongpyeongense]